jgi:hypothetical protein
MNQPVRKSLFAKPSYGPRSETFAIRVESYDTKGSPHSVLGTRLDSGESVRVWLRDVEQKGPNKRAEIKDFSAPRKGQLHPGTEAGGILLVQDAVKEADKFYSSRWLQALSHAPGEAEVFEATVHVSPLKRGAGQREYSLMTVIHDGNFAAVSDEMREAMMITPPFVVDNINDLKEALTSLLADKLGVGVRVSSVDSFDAMYVSRGNGTTIEQSVNTFIGSLGDLAATIDAGELTCEVIPFSNLFAGPKTVQTMAQNNLIQSRLSRYNGEPVASTKGKSYSPTIFNRTIVAARLTEPDPETGDRSMFFTHFEPLFTQPPITGLVNTLCYAQTDALAPAIPRPDRGNNAANNAEQAPAGAPAPAPSTGGHDDGSFDAGYSPTDDDLMQAAGGSPGNDDIGHPMEEQPVPDAASQTSPARRNWGARRGAN